jgi:2-amino-4-hydroxy-6-hydroxymethyldihydropteridine diphosphokinase
MKHIFYLHLGSNQGDRAQNILSAIDKIDIEIGKVLECSQMYETEPWGLTNQPFFINLALKCQSELSPREVLSKSKEIEASFGPEKETKWGPRLLDIDILYCDDLILDGDIVIPHPQIPYRNFVLIPLMEIAGDMVDPKTQMTIEELYDLCDDEGEVLIYED